MKRKLFILFIFLCFISECSNFSGGAEFQSGWHESLQRIWVGQEYWANRLQDWRVTEGRLECIMPGTNRNVHLLTRDLGARKGDFTMSVRFGLTGNDAEVSGKNWVGFRIGAKGEFDDYRDSAIYGKGLNAGITTEGRLFIGDFIPDIIRELESVRYALKQNGIELRVRAEPEDGTYKLNLSAFDLKTNTQLAVIKQDTISNITLTGNIALVSHLPDIKNEENTPVSWFSAWTISGSKVDIHENRAFGPILFSQYTLSKGIVKMTAQMPPVGEKDGKTVGLQIKNEDTGKWQKVAEAELDNISRTAVLRVENWDSSRDISYRLSYDLFGRNGQSETYHYEGTIRKDPIDREEIVVAAFTGNNDLGFPNNELVRHVRFHDPDILFFSGDQIYEGVGGYGVQRAPLDKACLDYLRKWYLYGWAYGELLRDRPVVAIPDDHDVYHGNIWGAGGKPTDKGLDGSDAQDSGGYKMLPEWVRMVEQTQTGHLPDPYDPTPVMQDIGVYYCDLNYAGISFAILEDRKFKSQPKILLPEANIRNGWAQNKAFNAEKEADAPSAVLLGDRQLRFLHNWAEDWSNNTWMKVVLSQTIFANVATLPEGSASGSIIPSLRILEPGAYAENDFPVSDMDSNGWPQTGRNKALREIRRAFALHIAGDQHLGSTIHYGIDDWEDASFALCVPSISNIWPRRWYPSTPGQNREPGAPQYTGNNKDGFGNKITVYAVSNPHYTGKKPSRLYDRATGYGLVRFNRSSRDIIIECWPRWVDPSEPDAQQYSGWPVKINQLDNFGRNAKYFLPELSFKGLADPVVQVIDQLSGEIVYTLRIKGTTFHPKVLTEGVYRIRAGEPGTEKMKEFSGIRSALRGEDRKIEIVF